MTKTKQGIERASPHVVTPDTGTRKLIDWLEQNRSLVIETLQEEGAILFHNFQVQALAEFRRAVSVISPELVEQYEAPTPRTEVSQQVYTSTEYPPEYTIPLHNEMSHTHKWPMKIWFFCHTPAAEGGETPIADSRQVFSLITPQTRQRFLDKKLLYIRNYGKEGDLLSWQQVFNVSKRAEAEEYFRQVGIQFEWKPDGGLRTRQTRNAIIRHPVTSEYVWFNQAHIFHLSNLAGAEKALLVEQYRGREEDLPYHTCYGDGSLIAEETLDKIRKAYQEAEVTFPWQKGDVLLLDNVLCAHGRRSFVGQRRIYVAMAEPHTVATV